jgi:hypothetical protein
VLIAVRVHLCQFLHVNCYMPVATLVVVPVAAPITVPVAAPVVVPIAAPAIVLAPVVVKFYVRCWD